MGQKTHPVGYRLGIFKDWDSRWFAEKDSEFSQNLIEDYKIKKFIRDNFRFAGISKIEISRVGEKVIINLHTARPGVIIGRRGAEVDRLRMEMQDMLKKQVEIEIIEVKNPLLEAQLIADSVAAQLERRAHFRRAMKRAASSAMEAGAKGVKIMCSGRLGGAEIARSEWYKEGKIPLQTLRSDVDFGFSEARTKYGVIGVKVWLYKGDALLDKEREEEEKE